MRDNAYPIIYTDKLRAAAGGARPFNALRAATQSSAAADGGSCGWPSKILEGHSVVEVFGTPAWPSKIECPVDVWRPRGREHEARSAVGAHH
jgi:hypothetical protein